MTKTLQSEAVKIVFMGTPPAAAVSLAKVLDLGHEVVAVYTQPDRPAGRGNKLHASAVKELAVERGLTVLQPEKIRNEQALEVFRSHAADVAVVVAYGRILPAGFINAFPSGAINVHFSLLPKYRGAAPVNWAIVNGEKVTGITTMMMDEGLDTGDILLQAQIEIGDTETAPELLERSAVVGAELLGQTLGRLADLERKPQDHAAASFAPILSRADGMIDWTMSAREIADRVRGFQPFPGTFSTFRGTPIKIWSAVAESDGSGSPGEIMEVGGDSFAIACGGSTRLIVTEVQPDGKRRLPARDFINGFHPVAGERFGV